MYGLISVNILLLYLLMIVHSIVKVFFPNIENNVHCTIGIVVMCNITMLPSILISLIFVRSGLTLETNLLDYWLGFAKKK